MLFSIIIPVYNAERYLEQAVQSIRIQDFSDYEVIFVNDGSSDGSQKIIDYYLSIDKRFHCYKQENRGPSAARNIGVHAAQGDYIVFLDVDDTLLKHSLSTIASRIEKTQESFYWFGYRIVDENNAVLSSYKPPRYHDVPLRDVRNCLHMIHSYGFSSIWSKVYSRRLLIRWKCDFQETLKIGEDLVFNVNLLLKTGKIYCCEEQIYNYRWAGKDSVTRKYDPRKMEKMIEFHLHLYKILTRKYGASKRLSADRTIQLERIFISCFMDLFREECGWNVRKKLKFIKSRLKKYPARYQWNDMLYMPPKRRLIHFLFLLRSNLMIYIASYLGYWMKFKYSGGYKSLFG